MWRAFMRSHYMGVGSVGIPKKQADDLQLLLNQHARSILGLLPTTPQGGQMRESWLTPAPVILDCRQQQFSARLADACSIKLKKLHRNHSSGAPICRVVKEKHEHGWRTKGRNWPAPGKEPVVRTSTLDDTPAAKRTAHHCAREKEAKIGAGVWMRWTDRLHPDNGQVGAAAVGKNWNRWRSCRSYLGIGCMEVFDAELWAMRLALEVTFQMREKLQRHGVKTVEVVSDSQTTIWQAAHLEPGPGQQLVRQINRRGQAILAHSIATAIHSVPGC